jgi:diguanylate cyclase (GGDEF)-like protein
LRSIVRRSLCTVTRSLDGGVTHRCSSARAVTNARIPAEAKSTAHEDGIDSPVISIERRVGAALTIPNQMSTTLEHPKSAPKPADAMEAFLASGAALPTAPAIATRILDAVRSDDESMAALAAVIATDPALTARVLSVANSSLYAPGRKVDRLDAAIAVIGTNALKNIALSFVVLKVLGEKASTGLDLDLFMKRALTGAASADLAAKLIGHREDLFASALLRDVGVLVFSLCAEARYAQVLDEESLHRETLDAIETRTFGFDHQALGAEILRRWGLPETICAPIRWHHQPERAGEAERRAAELLNLSDRIAAIYHGFRNAEELGAIKRILCSQHGVAESDVDTMIDQVADRMREVFATFEIDASMVKPYSRLLLEANEELRKLNLSYEQLVMELKRSQQRAEKLAAELSEANATLREMATRDGLTGLYNHRAFQDLLRREIAEAQRYRRPLSLVLFDIDHFKKVNDTYGHPAGDTVLREVSRVTAEVARAADIAARYGGEEFAVVLPETEARGAVMFAERIRRAIEAQEIVCGAQRLRVTVSVGVCPWTPDPTADPLPNFIEVADKALYAAKHGGRNRICVGR